MDDSDDHDILIELRTQFRNFQEESRKDRNDLHQELGNLKGDVTTLKDAANQVKGGARVLHALWAALGAAGGLFAGFLAWSKHP